MVFFFFNDTATTEIYTLSLHDALPILSPKQSAGWCIPWSGRKAARLRMKPTPHSLPQWLSPFMHEYTSAIGASAAPEDRKSTRLNSSHANISYAVFCLKKNPWKYSQPN